MRASGRWQASSIDKSSSHFHGVAAKVRRRDPGHPSAKSSLRAGPPRFLVEGPPQMVGHGAAQLPENEVSTFAGVGSINCDMRNGLAR
ncbi:hypothetical protein SAMN05216228_101799 [Rhizobium tibeticum]|uniref:Uncharacterized protein n=1 Tax=Rhizobium tibeticum TaxID=501024 RepID=A0A1H8PU23_9HYPH|nr:hypothetical protein RTCCBAU85039_3538 [Rhizobium tibeticum]SEO45043.1 hypothetical protein SAMN05216228_101799 [Rhizobium tibeticum]